MRIFLSGASGALGRPAVPLLLEAGHEVTAVGRTPEKRKLLEGLGARAVEVDLFDAAAVARAVRGADAICNLATAVPPADLRLLLPWSWHEMDRVRRRVSANLVDAALAGETVRRVIQESFAPIYAAAGDAWVDETSLVRPARYNRSALDAEAHTERFTRGGRDGVVLRFGMFCGPGDPATLQLVDAIRRGWFPLFGRPDAYSSWAAHEDAARAVVAALDVPPGIYNVVEDEPMRRRELADGMAALLGVRPPRFLPAWWVGRSRGRSGSPTESSRVPAAGPRAIRRSSMDSRRWCEGARARERSRVARRGSDHRRSLCEVRPARFQVSPAARVWSRPLGRLAGHHVRRSPLGWIGLSRANSVTHRPRPRAGPRSPSRHLAASSRHRRGATSLENTPERTEARSLRRVFTELGDSYRSYRRKTAAPVSPAVREAATRFRKEPSVASLVSVAAQLDELKILSW